MRVLLLGATGLIGTALAARLRAEGHHVIGARRRTGPASSRVPVSQWVELDLRSLVLPDQWRPFLNEVDAVINCAGVLQDGPGDSTRKVHDAAPAALWQACERAGVRRVIQLSAIGVDRAVPTAFSSSKRDGDAALEASTLDWVILRPSVVVGQAAYGGSALFRALASLPILPLIPDTGPIDVVQLDDVTETVVRMLTRGAPSRVALDLPGPDRLSVVEIVAAYRSWLGWPPAQIVPVPAFLLRLMWRAGDLVSWLGWRTPIRTTARVELGRGAIGDGGDWTRIVGVRPTSLADALAARPASVQERWFARLYLLKPLAIGALALFWLLTGLISLGPGWHVGMDHISSTAAAGVAVPAVIAGATFDILIGLAILVRRTARAGLIAALIVSLTYLLLGSVLLPSLWSDPIGPLSKILPISALTLLCLAILDDR